MKPIKSISIQGRRWFQRSAGNTYCSASILVNGEPVHELPRQYGYGDYYLQAATEWLDENGYIHPEHYKWGGTEPLWQVQDREGFDLYTTVADVSRERDL